MQLQSISRNLAELNHDRNNNWTPKPDPSLSKPAVFAFDGEVYNGLDISSFEVDEIGYMQEKLRILSGLYGLLKPMDLILPYRLEMGTRLKIRRANTLYEFWKDKLAKSLMAEMDEDELLINLASNEYFRSINTKGLQSRVIEIVFKDPGSGGHKVLSFYAKKARGQMARYILKNRINHVEDLKGFTTDGYYFDNEQSKENILVFLNDRKS